MIASVLLSSLAAKFPPGARAAFLAAHPGPWLVWEPGKWAPVPRAELTKQTEQLKVVPPPRRASATAALAMRLDLEPGQDALTLGRDPECELHINDATLSRAHLRFTRAGTTWFVADMGSMNGSQLSGLRLEPARPVPLNDGAEIDAGEVLLTYHSSEKLFARLHPLR